MEIQGIQAIQPRRTYGRRSKPLRASRRAALELLNEIGILLNGIDAGTLAPEKLFSKIMPSAVHLEIGFGTGEHVAAMAVAHPADIFLAAEPYMAGVATLIKNLQANNLLNIRVYPADGLALLMALTSNSVDHAYVLFPDPWPKKRHHERRFIQPETLDEFVRVLRPGGTLLLGSDDPGMVDWMLSHAVAHPAFSWTARCAADWQTPPTGIYSRYAEKACAAGKPLYYLQFRRV